MKKVKTKDVKSAIEKFALLNDIPLKDCSFNLNKVETFMINTFLDHFQSYNDDINAYYNDPEKMINEHVALNQIYTISLKKNSNSIIKLNYTIVYDDFSVHPKIIISPDSTIPYKQHKASEILLLLVKEINKIKAKHNILIKIFDDNMMEMN